MAEDHYYLTVARERRQPQNDGYIAVISLGQPQLGDDHVTVCDVEVVPNMKAARKWFKRQVAEKPWEPRN